MRNEKGGENMNEEFLNKFEEILDRKLEEKIVRVLDQKLEENK